MSVTSTISNTWKSLPGYGKLIIIAVMIVALYFVAWNPLKKFINKQKVKARLHEFEKNSIQLPDGGSINPGNLAAEVYDAIWNNDWFGWTEDETRIVDALNKIPKQYISFVEDAYASLYEKVMREDVINALSAEEWNSLKSLFD